MNASWKRLSALLLAALLLTGLALPAEAKSKKKKKTPTPRPQITATPTVSPTPAPADEADVFVTEDGEYTDKEHVAAYLRAYGHLPSNYITKREAQELGWVARYGNLDRVAPGKSIGGDRFGNYEGQLPDARGRRWTECDIDFDGSYRNGKRIVFSNDGLIYYTDDHYESFDEIEVVWSQDEESGYAYQDPAQNEGSGLFSDEDMDAIMNWLFGE